MAEYLVQSESLTAVADEIRVLSGTTDTMGLEAMATNVNTANEEVNDQANLISQIATVLEGKAGGSAEPVLQSKTVTPSTSEQVVTADNGYDGLKQVTVNEMPTAAQAIPSISVSASGLITASSVQSEGYVAGGTKSTTKQLGIQAAQTIIPGTTDQTIAAGKYLTGAQIIKGDPNLVPEYILKNHSIFGVEGAAEAGGSEGKSTITVIIRTQDKSISYIDESGNILYVDHYQTKTVEAHGGLVCIDSGTPNISGNYITLGANWYAILTDGSSVSGPGGGGGN